MRILDQCLLVHALGKVDEDIFYEWQSLWQMDETQKAAISKTNAEAAKIIVDSGLVPFEALAKGFQNQLVEDGTYPGIEAAIQESEAAGDFVGEPLQLTLAKEKPKALPPPKKPVTASGDTSTIEDLVDARLARIEDALARLATDGPFVDDPWTSMDD